MEITLKLQQNNKINLTIKNGKEEIHATIWEDNNQLIFDSELSELNGTIKSYSQLINNIKQLQNFVA